MLININTTSASYKVRIEQELESFSCFAGEYTDQEKIFLLTDTTVGPLYAPPLAKAAEKEGFNMEEIRLPDGEKYKSFQSAEKIYDRLIEGGAERGTPLAALGGGVIGDLGGFVASTFMRGIPFFNIPTSLIAQADSAIGGKTGVNLSQGKNLVGTFYQPRYVHTDVSVLKTLREKEFICGLAEVVKHAVIKGENFFSYLKNNAPAILDREPEVMEVVVGECVKIKGEVVEKDEREKGLRKILNLGHTFGHALEAELGYGTITHGEGVSCGMVLAAEIAERKGLAFKGLRTEIEELLRVYTLPTRVKADFEVDKIVKRMYFDKKVRKKKLEFVLPEKIGKVKTSVVVEENEVKEALSEIYG